MILLIDNYDSFVFNLARYVVELGYKMDVYRNDKISLKDISNMAPSHIIISPGPCSPNEAGICLELIQQFMDTIPILGVCLGHQAIAQACGGKVVRALHPKHGKSDKVHHDGTGIFSNLPNPLKVARYHSLIVENGSLPQEVKVTAATTENEIMAIQHQSYPMVGVQFHPESVLTEYGHAMLQTFLQMR
jgi:anthranilate synthase/aminodeoxychorismate synthase-like glutamine amidotransferase